MNKHCDMEFKIVSSFYSTVSTLASRRRRLSSASSDPPPPEYDRRSVVPKNWKWESVKDDIDAFYRFSRPHTVKCTVRLVHFLSDSKL